MEKIIVLNGTVFSEHVGQSVTEEEFSDAFIAFLEEHGWLYGGLVAEEDSDE